MERIPRRKQRVTLRDVAQHAGVSPKTVSNVLNDWPYVTDETRAKVQASIEALGYRQSILAAGLRSGRTKTIGVVIPDITNPFFGQVVRGCEDVLYAAGYSIFLCNTNEDAVKERAYLDSLVSRGVDGLLLFGARADSAALAALVPGDLPIVAEDSPAHDLNTTVIEIDNRGGAALATRHLLESGHRRIAHLGGPSERAAATGRQEGYRQALESAGIGYDPALVVRCRPTLRGGYHAALHLLGRHIGQHIGEPPPTALFCYNDLMAVGAMVACRRLGLTIPGDLALVGFDDIAIASLVTPILTTVRVQQYQLGRLASDLLLQRLAGSGDVASQVKFPVELIVRGSCGARQISPEQITGMLEHLLDSDLVDLEPCQAPP
ncbi:MAG: LacI family DNA-binding transcriptional regulator [Caldilineaceae bacterium]|nr:LacI family DNA-binding transcriptional regulator [Caldilineaceae bacterium]